jgi:nitroimidazol reductase NimA-like FMN-containing flavoprotein (pyridoxamine 5'-phosphate oxidase superfamily)
MPKRPPARPTPRHRPIRASKIARKIEPPADRPFAPGYGIAGPEDGKGLLPWAWVAGKMNRCRTFWLATIHPGTVEGAQARPHVMPVWGVWLEDGFFFSTGHKSRKAQNLAANPACSITNDDGAEAVIVEGRALEIKKAPTLERVAAAYKRRYKMDPRSMGEPIFKVEPAKVFAFIEKSFPKTATRWKV